MTPCRSSASVTTGGRSGVTSNVPSVSTVSSTLAVHLEFLAGDDAISMREEIVQYHKDLRL